MGALTVAEAFGQTLEQAIDAILAPRRPEPRMDGPRCPVCGGATSRAELSGGAVLASCHECGSAVESSPPVRATLRLVG
ncbi:MAG TPA: hypothetical protein VMU66_02270 [Gaiellales bacterium]|nr:hypothetical protein [Gaiellales bacterium]